jgi:hypothetical protein
VLYFMNRLTILCKSVLTTHIFHKLLAVFVDIKVCVWRVFVQHRIKEYENQTSTEFGDCPF